jgi:hypothetical protein
MGFRRTIILGSLAAAGYYLFGKGKQDNSKKSSNKAQ